MSQPLVQQPLLHARPLLEEIYHAVVKKSGAQEVVIGSPNAMMRVLAELPVRPRPVRAKYVETAIIEALGQHWILAFGIAEDRASSSPYDSDLILVPYESSGRISSKECEIIREAIARANRINCSILCAHKDGTIRVTDSLKFSKEIIETLSFWFGDTYCIKNPHPRKPDSVSYLRVVREPEVTYLKSLVDPAAQAFVSMLQQRQRANIS